MSLKKVYQCDGNGFYVGVTFADESPLEPGVFHIPAGCVEKEPPPIGQNQRAKWSSGRWYLSDIPAEPAAHKPEPSESAMEIAVALRKSLYRAESDPLKIEAEYDALMSGSEPDYGPWKKAVQSIKDRVPLPTTAK